MLFDAPEIIQSIPDIKKIYEINADQEAMLDASVNALFDDIFLETMDETKTARWEKMLSIIPLDTDTLSERRFRIQTRVLERMPYTYRVILRKLQTLCPGGVDWTVDTEKQLIIVRVALASKNMRADVDELLDNVLPLNMEYTLIILYNTYAMLAKHTNGNLKQFTHQQMRDDTAIGGV
jgi:hypothetical protein|nr:MAG TPA_asm: tail protein [Caudoviricetes sp.]